MLPSPAAIDLPLNLTRNVPARVSPQEQARRDACAAEPIRTPGSVQPHGVLVIVDAATWKLQHISDNAAGVFGRTPESMLGHPLQGMFGPDALQEFRDILDTTVLAANPAVVTVGDAVFDAIVHRNDGLVLIELEPAMPQRASWSTAVLYGAMHDLTHIRTAPELWAATARAVRQITGFDQVMVYHFHEDDHGEVVGEDVAEGMQPYLGLHYPASDIPQQARELYLRKLSRVIATTAEAPSALLTVAGVDGERVDAAGPVDLSAAQLRSVSPNHLAFMRNMGQASTLSFSLIHQKKLIGMITCAHRSPRRVPFVLRQGLEILAAQVAAQLSSIASIARLSRRVAVRAVRATLIDQLGADADVAHALLNAPTSVLDFITADGASIRIDGVTTSRGETPTRAQLTALMAALQSRDGGLAFTTDALPIDHPDLAALAPTVYGMLVVPIGVGGDFVAWFRGEVVRKVDWLGDQSPSNRPTPLSPRNSLAAWAQDVTGTAPGWEGLQTDAAEFGLDLESALFRRAESRLAHVALHDPLTGLPNRRMLMGRLESAREASGADDVAVLFIDLDRFKRVNDVHGHEAGDALLVETARRLTAAVRSHDVVARIGGDEFIVVCEKTPLADAEALAERILTALRVGRPGRSHEAPITASIGITGAHQSVDASDLLRRADAAMYRAKARGRDQVAR